MELAVLAHSLLDIAVCVLQEHWAAGLALLEHSLQVAAHREEHLPLAVGHSIFPFA